MWTYEQATGILSWQGRKIGRGYAGTGEGRNNPLLEGVRSVGPIPRGRYHIGKSYRHKSLGPVVMNLDPIGHDALGRTHFRIHGDSKDGDASRGCIVLNRTLRERIRASGEKELNVV